MFQIEITASVIAWYGAVVATVSLMMGIFAFFRDRSKIKVKVKHAFLTGKKIWMISIEVVNTGRRTVTLEGAGFMTKDGKQIVLQQSWPISFPYELSEGKSASVMFEKEDLEQQLQEERTVISRAWFRDATGKRYEKRFRLTP